MTEYRINQIKGKIEKFPLIAVKNGIVILSSADGDSDISVPRSGQWAAEFFSPADSLLFTQCIRKSGMLSLCRGGEFCEEILFFDTISARGDNVPVLILCGEDPIPVDADTSAFLPAFNRRFTDSLSGFLTENQIHLYVTRYKAISSCFKILSNKQKGKSFSSPLYQIEALNKIYKKKFKTGLSAISIKELSPEARRAELFLPPEVLCAIIFLSTAFISRCIVPNPASPDIKSNLLFYDNRAVLSFSAAAEDTGYYSLSCDTPLDARKIFPSFSGELTALFRLCANTACAFSLTLSDGEVSLSYTFPAFMRRQRIRAQREREAELEFYDILADFIL